MVSLRPGYIFLILFLRTSPISALTISLEFIWDLFGLTKSHGIERHYLQYSAKAQDLLANESNFLNFSNCEEEIRNCLKLFLAIRIIQLFCPADSAAPPQKRNGSEEIQGSYEEAHIVRG